MRVKAFMLFLTSATYLLLRFVWWAVLQLRCSKEGCSIHLRVI